MQKKIYIVGNWKMNPQDTTEARRIFQILSRTKFRANKVEVVLCPPFVFIKEIADYVAKKKAKGFAVGAQNVSFEDKGSLTGEISVGMLASVRAPYIIVGHSERRAMGESNLDVNKKLHKVILGGLTPIVCIGESNRDENGEFLHDLAKQINESLAGLASADLEKIIIAYEPVWAIGKSEKDAPTPHIIHEMTIQIQKILAERYGKERAKAVRILYGGSVTVNIAENILKHGNVDGLLIGRQSLIPEELANIIIYADKL